MYTVTDYKSKAELKRALSTGEKVRVYQPNADLFGKDPMAPVNGVVYLEGPHYPKPHTWYAEGVAQGGYLVKVK